MYESIRIQNFRGLKDLTIENLGRVNLLVGANNVGKTSVLEALALLHMHRDGYELGVILESRGYREGESLDGALTGLFCGNDLAFEIGGKRTDGPIAWLRGDRNLVIPASDSRRTSFLHVEFNSRENARLYYHLDPQSSRLTVNGKAEGDAERLLDVPLSRDRAYPRPYLASKLGDVAFLPSWPRLNTPNLANLFTERERVGQVGSIAQQMRSFDERIMDMFVGFDLTDREVTVDVKLGGDVATDVIPLRSMGEGSRRLLELVLALPLAVNGVGLIDEVESGVYFGNLPVLWQLLNDTSKDGQIQILAATHSWECVTAAVEAFRESPDDFRLVRLYRRGGEVHALVTDWELAENAAEQLIEVR